MQRQHDVLGDHVALRVHQRTGRVLRLAHDGGKAGAEQRVLHLLHDAGEARLDDFEVDGVDGHLLYLYASETVILRWPRSGPRRMRPRRPGRRPSRLASLAPQGDGEHDHFSSVTIKFFHSSTRAAWRAPITVVQSN